MSESPTHKTTTRPQRSAAILLLKTAMDTSWRAFVPTIGGTIIGILLDKTFSIVPVMTMICMLGGFILSAVLITMQLRKISQERRA